MKRNKLLPIFLMPVILIVAYLLDEWTGAVTLFTSRTFQFTLAAAVLSLFDVIFAGLFILLIWAILMRGVGSIRLSLTYIGVGLLLVMFTSRIVTHTQGKYLALASAVILILGCVNLVRKKEPSVPLISSANPKE